MIVVPAVDIRDGKVVRLRQGRLSDQTVYGHDPVEAARRWESEGAARLHLVDLDAATGRAPQAEAVAAVIRGVRVPVEVGGGIRSVAAAERHLASGADRVIFGTATVGSPDVVQEAVQRWPRAVAVAIDARNGRVAVDGWTGLTSVEVLDLAKQVVAWGVTRIQLTDIARDGMLAGPDLRDVERLARLGGIRITAAGGVASLDDLILLARLEGLGLDEVVVGKALYDGKFTLTEAQAALASERDDGARASREPF